MSSRGMGWCHGIHGIIIIIILILIHQDEDEEMYIIVLRGCDGAVGMWRRNDVEGRHHELIVDVAQQQRTEEGLREGKIAWDSWWCHHYSHSP